MDYTYYSNENIRNTSKLEDTDAEKIEKQLKFLLEVGSKVPADKDDYTIDLPDFFDAEKFHLGQDVFRKNIFTMMIAKLSGLLLLLAVPSILNILKFTKQSGSPCTAFRRYASTILHTCIWYKSTPNQNDAFLKSLKNVRKKHCIASRRSFEVGIGRISQLDMALTQFGFMGFSLLCSEQLGILMTEREVDGLLHFWRVIGHMLGTEERFNLCKGNVGETKALCRRLLEEIFIPHLARKTNDFEQMSQALLDGLWPINPFINNHAFKAITHFLISTSVSNNINNNNNNNNNNNISILDINTENIPIYSKIILNVQLSVHKYLLQTQYWWSSLFRYYFNSQMKLSIYLTEKFPFLAYLIFGKKQSYFNMYKFHLE